jgi:hypothetical protein
MVQRPRNTASFHGIGENTEFSSLLFLKIGWIVAGGSRYRDRPRELTTPDFGSALGTSFPLPGFPVSQASVPFQK